MCMFCRDSPLGFVVPALPQQKHQYQVGNKSIANSDLSIMFFQSSRAAWRNSVECLTQEPKIPGSIPDPATYFRFLQKGSCHLLAEVCSLSTG